LRQALRETGSHEPGRARHEYGMHRLRSAGPGTGHPGTSACR
jgi:hypothetical protein